MIRRPTRASHLDFKIFHTGVPGSAGRLFGAGSGHATRKRDRLHRRGRSRHPGGRGRPCGLCDAAGWEWRMKRTVKRAAKWLSIAMAVLLMAGIAAPYLSGNRFAPCIRAALENALGRKVELGAIHFSLFAEPGFSVDNVVIHENPAIGIEPIAYVGSLEAVPRLTSIFGIFGGRLEFASILLDERQHQRCQDGRPFRAMPLELQAAAEPVGDPPSVRPRTRAAAHLEPHCLRGGFTGREILDDGLDLISTFALGRGPREWL